MTPNQQEQRTPGPWIFEDGQDMIWAKVIPDDGGDVICNAPRRGYSAERWDANAAFIVEACNSHDRLFADKVALLEACKMADRILLQQKSYNEQSREAMGIIEAAIAQAERP